MCCCSIPQPSDRWSVKARVRDRRSLRVRLAHEGLSNIRLARSRLSGTSRDALP
jgi:hypothetical protein